MKIVWRIVKHHSEPIKDSYLLDNWKRKQLENFTYSVSWQFKMWYIQHELMGEHGCDVFYGFHCQAQVIKAFNPGGTVSVHSILVSESIHLRALINGRIGVKDTDQLFLIDLCNSSPNHFRRLLRFCNVYLSIFGFSSKLREQNCFVGTYLK